MSAFVYGAMLQWKLDLRDKGILLTYYIVPLLFFAFMGAIFSSINPGSKDTLIQSMTIFGVSMGSFLGTPVPLIDLYGTDIIKAYKVGGIPLWTGAVNNCISAFVHLFIMSTLIFVIAPVAYGAKMPGDLLSYFFSLAVFIATCVSVGTTLGLYVKSTAKLTIVSQVLFLPSLMLSGIMFPTNLLPGVLETIGKIFPATWGLVTMTSSSVAMENYLPLLLIVLVTTIANSYKVSKAGKE